MAPKQYRIVGGPSKFDLMIAFFARELDGGRRSVTFSLSFPRVIDDLRWLEDVEVILNDLQWEDGSGESWNWKGYTLGAKQRGWGPDVEGHFSTHTRLGWLRVREIAAV